jgi:hypothetical protein
LIAMQIVEETSVATPRMTGVAGALQKAEQWLGSTVAAAAALLVVAEIIVLFAGVSARYFFQRPLIWSDEFAGILFLWLAMLGAVVAFQRGEHMRMTAFVGRLIRAGASSSIFSRSRPPWRSWCSCWTRPTSSRPMKPLCRRRRSIFRISGAPRRCRLGWA